MRLSLRARLLGAMIAAVIVIFLCSLFAARSVLSHDLYDLARTEVTSEASAFGGYIASRKQQVELLVAQEAASDVLRAELAHRNAGALRSELSASANNAGLSFLTVVDTGGKVVARSQGSAGGSLAHDALVQSALNGEALATVWILSPAFLASEGLALQIGSQGSGLAIAAATPISDAQGRTIGALYGGVLMNHSYDLVDEATRAIGGASALLQGDTIVSSSIVRPDGTRFVDAPVTAADDVVRTGRAFVNSDTEGGVAYFASITPLTDIRGRTIGAAWYGLPLSQITNIVGHTTQALVLWLVLAVIVVLALTVPFVQGLSNTIARNSTRIRETAKELGIVIVGSEISGDQVASAKRAVEHSGELLAQAAAGQASERIDELQKLNSELESDVTVIETLTHEMSTRMNDAAARVAELNEVAATLNELVTGDSGS